MRGPRAAALATCLATLVAVAGAKKQQHMAYRNNMACDTVCMRQQTALLDAVEEDDEPEVRRLLEAGAIVDNHLASRKHETALHRAALFAHLSVAKLLLTHGADADARDKFGETPLHKVAQNIAADHTHVYGGEGTAALNHHSMAALLVSKGADLNAADGTYGWTPLHWASYQGHLEVVTLLLERGANPRITDNMQGESALHLAAIRGHPDICRTLLAKEAEDKRQGREPVHIPGQKDRRDEPLSQVKDFAGETAINKARRKLGGDGMQDWNRPESQADVLAELELVLTPEYFSQMCADPHFHNKEL